MAENRSVVVISSSKTKLYKWAQDEGHEVVARGDSETDLAAAIDAMARPAGLLVLDGHGSGWHASYASSSSSETGRSVDFNPVSIGAPHVVMSMCYGLLDHYVSAIRNTGSPVVDVVGPIGVIGSTTYRATVEHLIDRFVAGVEPATALEEARKLGVTVNSAGWGVAAL